MTPYSIQIGDAALARIRARVADYVWPFEASAPAWSLGADAGFMRRLQRYWLDVYDWRAAERRLNAAEQSLIPVDGIDIHVIRHRSANPDAMPLLLIHGWPGSVLEFAEMAPRLAHPEKFGLDPAIAFDVIVAALPGYGFSSKPDQPIGARRTAEIFNRLMTDKLGYDRYFAQGGDWGSLVSAWLGYDHAAHCRAIHLNLIGLSPGGDGPGMIGWGVLPPETAEEKAWATKTGAIVADGGGYFMIQSTRPQTLGYAMSDSPMGVAAWIIEKFHAWSDLRHGGLQDVFGFDALLTNVMIYLVTDSFNTAAWMYAGSAREGVALPAGKRVEVPVGVANMPVDWWPTPPRSYIDKGYNITHWTDLPRGGHFAAMEVPDLLAADIRRFFGSLFGSL